MTTTYTILGEEKSDRLISADFCPVFDAIVFVDWTILCSCHLVWGGREKRGSNLTE